MTLNEFRRAALLPDRRSSLAYGALFLLYLITVLLLLLVAGPSVFVATRAWFHATFLLLLIVVNMLLIANAARRARRPEARQAETWKPWVDRLTRLLPKRLSTRGYLIYEHAAGDVQAVKEGFRWWPLLLTPFGAPFAWAIQLRFWWLVVMTLVLQLAEVVEDVFFPNDWSHPLLLARLLALGFSFAVFIAYLVALFEADDREGRRLEKTGYTLVDHIHGRSGPHAIALFAAQK